MAARGELAELVDARRSEELPTLARNKTAREGTGTLGQDASRPTRLALLASGILASPWLRPGHAGRPGFGTTKRAKKQVTAGGAVNCAPTKAGILLVERASGCLRHDGHDQR